FPAILLRFPGAIIAAEPVRYHRGSFPRASEEDPMRAIDPTTGMTIRDYPDHPAEEIERRIGRAAAASRAWRERPVESRATLLASAAAALRRGRDDLAALMIAEMGKTIAGAEAEVEKCATCCEYFAANAAAFLAPRPIATEASSSYVRFDPL